MLITFIPCSVIGSGYAGKCGVKPLKKGIVARALQDGTITFDRLRDAEEKARAAFVAAGNFPGYIPKLDRVEVEV